MCIELVRKNQGIKIELDQISLDDRKVFDLYANGDKKGIFQFESHGIEEFLHKLQPNKFEEIVAINALYRPGSMDYIPEYIERKQGRKPISYRHPMMESFLKETYGLLIYQEQMMQMAKTFADFTPDKADLLRKAMGAKRANLLSELKPEFIEGCQNNPEFVKDCNEMGANIMDLIEAIWSDWLKDSAYMFSKSHAVAYTRISYHTAYLKTYFYEEFNEVYKTI